LRSGANDQRSIAAIDDAPSDDRGHVAKRYRVEFTIGEESHDKLRRVQTLLRREIPDGDPGAIFDRALTLLLAKIEKAKLGAAGKPQSARSIRPGTDRDVRTPVLRSRDIPRPVKRGVNQRDGGQCAFLAKDGRRCTERAFLEFHHVHPFAKGGPATVENIALRCRRHNQYEANLVFGPHGTSVVGEGEPFRARSDGSIHLGSRTPRPAHQGNRL
jgi:hypothetical protein